MTNARTADQFINDIAAIPEGLDLGSGFIGETVNTAREIVAARIWPDIRLAVALYTLAEVAACNWDGEPLLDEDGQGIYDISNDETHDLLVKIIERAREVSA